jgi:hypothetical protein
VLFRQRVACCSVNDDGLRFDLCAFWLHHRRRQNMLLLPIGTVQKTKPYTDACQTMHLAARAGASLFYEAEASLFYDSTRYLVL